MKAKITTDLNDGTHSRFDADHYNNCDPCYEAHLDFMYEQEQDARDEASEYQNNED